MHKLYKKQLLDKFDFIIKKSVSRRGFFFVLLLIAVLLINVIGILAFEPNGANINPGESQTAPNDTAIGVPAQAGNITQLDIFGYSVTQSWQGYFGNVTGVIHLADSNDNVMYNWTLADPEGEVYASTNSTIIWTNIQCFNFTANQSYNNEANNGGATNLYGLNLTGLESRYNINNSDVDGIDETFGLIGTGTHDTFYTAQKEFSEGECRSTRAFGSSGSGVNNEFEEVLLYEPATTSVIYAALLEKGNVAGFNQQDNDFEMLVLEDGHGSDVETTTYYFFVEIE